MHFVMFFFTYYVADIKSLYKLNVLLKVTIFEY